jgi:hypothetical protein
MWDCDMLRQQHLTPGFHAERVPNNSVTSGDVTYGWDLLCARWTANS